MRPVYGWSTQMTLLHFLSCELTRKRARNIPEPSGSERQIRIMRDEPVQITVRFSQRTTTSIAELQGPLNQFIIEAPE